MTGTPLLGRRLLVTRRPAQSADLVTRLRALGADVVEVPTLAIEPPEDLSPLREAAARLGTYHWLMLASANAAEAIGSAWRDSGADWPERLLVGSVGPATTAAVRTFAPDARIAVEPADDHSAKGLLHLLQIVDLYGARILLPAGDRARDELAAGLRSRGAHLDVVTAYRTTVPDGAAEALRAALAGAPLDAALFASPSAVEGFLALAGEAVPAVPAIAIGPTTAEAARRAGLVVAGVADPSTTEGLCAATVRALAARA